MVGGDDFAKVIKNVFFDEVTTPVLNCDNIKANGIVIDSPPTDPFDAVNKQYVDSLIAGAVSGPGTSTTNAVAVWSDTSGTTLLSSPTTIDAFGNIMGVNTITMNPFGTIDGRDVAADGATLDAHVIDTANPHATTKSQVGLSEVPNVKQNLTAVTPPTATDDSTLNYSIGSRWVDVLTDEEYVCVDASPTVAVWKSTTASGSGSGNLLLSGNTISSTNLNGDINILPDGTGEVLLKSDPVSALGAATKAYVDASVGGATKTIVALDNVSWAPISPYLRGVGKIVFSVDTNGFPMVVVDIGKNNSGSSFFSEFRTCNLTGVGATTITLRWLTGSGVEAQTSGAAANTNYVVTVTGFN